MGRWPPISSKEVGSRGKKRTYKRLYVRSYELLNLYVCLYVLQNLYERSFMRGYVLANLHVRLSVLLKSYVCSYVLPNTYGHLYVLSNLYVKRKRKKSIYYTTLSYTTDNILPDLLTTE